MLKPSYEGRKNDTIPAFTDQVTIPRTLLNFVLT